MKQMIQSWWDQPFILLFWSCFTTAPGIFCAQVCVCVGFHHLCVQKLCTAESWGPLADRRVHTQLINTVHRGAVHHRAGAGGVPQNGRVSFRGQAGSSHVWCRGASVWILQLQNKLSPQTILHLNPLSSAQSFKPNPLKPGPGSRISSSN